MTDKPVFSSTQLYDGLRGLGPDLSALAPVSWPTMKDETWRYTDLSALASRSFWPVDRLEGVLPPELKGLIIPGALNFVFVNGILAESLSFADVLPNGLKVTTGKAALMVCDDQQKTGAVGIFAGLNRAFAKDAVVVEFSGKDHRRQLVQVIHLLDGSRGKPAVFPRTLIRVASGGKASVLETFAGFMTGEYFSNALTRIILEEGAFLERVQAHQHAEDAFHVGATHVSQAKDSRFQDLVLTTGAKLFRHDMDVVLEGEGSDAVLNGLHALKGDRHADSHTTIRHAAPSARSRQLYKAVLEDRSHSVFNGRIVVDQKAQLTNSYQLNKNLLLGPRCRVDTKPQLEIHADDVKCTHGATTGQLNDEQVFYLQTRGMDRADASRMLIRGFMDDVLNQVNDPVLKGAVVKMAMV